MLDFGEEYKSLSIRALILTIFPMLAMIMPCIASYKEHNPGMLVACAFIFAPFSSICFYYYTKLKKKSQYIRDLSQQITKGSADCATQILGKLQGWEVVVVYEYLRKSEADKLDLIVTELEKRNLIDKSAFKPHESLIIGKANYGPRGRLSGCMLLLNNSIICQLNIIMDDPYFINYADIDYYFIKVSFGSEYIGIFYNRGHFHETILFMPNNRKIWLDMFQQKGIEMKKT